MVSESMFLGLGDASKMYSVSRPYIVQQIRDGRGSYFFHGAGWGRERRGQKSMGQGKPPLPHSAGRGGEGVKICGAGSS